MSSVEEKLDGIQRFIDGMVQTHGYGQEQFDACNDVRAALLTKPEPPPHNITNYNRSAHE